LQAPLFHARTPLPGSGLKPFLPCPI